MYLRYVLDVRLGRFEEQRTTGGCGGRDGGKREEGGMGRVGGWKMREGEEESVVEREEWAGNDVHILT